MLCCLIGRDSNLWFGLTDFFIDDEEAVKSRCSGNKANEEGKCSRARDVRAFPGNFDFLLSQPSQKGGFFRKNTMFRIRFMDGRVS